MKDLTLLYHLHHQRKRTLRWNYISLHLGSKGGSLELLGQQAIEEPVLLLILSPFLILRVIEEVVNSVCELFSFLKFFYMTDRFSGLLMRAIIDKKFISMANQLLQVLYASICTSTTFKTGLLSVRSLISQFRQRMHWKLLQSFRVLSLSLKFSKGLILL
jgi:hypothetical protein